MKIPVFVINGFLESGKTVFGKQTISDEYFYHGEVTVLIACENGIEKYDAEELADYQCRLEVVRSKDEMTPEFLTALQKKHRPTQILMEYNGMWGMDFLKNLEMPKGWFLAQMVTMVDAGTFDIYMNNMKSQFMDMCRESDLVIFNRCKENTKAAAYKRNIRAVNPRAQVVFEKEYGEDFEFEEELPFDINAPVIEVKDEDYGIWYIDAMDHPDKYAGKNIRFKGMVYKLGRLKTNNEMFIPGRMAMTCCADDTAFIGFLCRCGRISELKQKDWITVTAKMTKEYRKEYREEGIVLTAIEIQPAEPPKEELVYF